MPIKWETTHVEIPAGRVTITHWKRHDPHKLLAALSDTSREAKSLSLSRVPNPRVYRHKFGSLELASRKMDYKENSAHEEPNTLFSHLNELVDKRVSIVETPVAKVVHPDGTVQVVTIWKKGTQPLTTFLQSNLVHKTDKLNACFSAMKLLAKLHAAGYVHGHPRSDNFVVDSQSKVHLVDYVRLCKLEESANIIDSTQLSRSLTDDALSRADLTAAYDKALALYKARFEKRAHSSK